MEEWAIILSLDPYNICTVHATLSVLCTSMSIYSHYHYQLAFLTLAVPSLLLSNVVLLYKLLARRIVMIAHLFCVNSSITQFCYH
jgi:hypothetical protein